MNKLAPVWVLAALAVGATATQAMADSTLQPSVRINYANLDLSRSADAQLLYRRLKQAAATVCGNVDSRELAAYRVYQRCYQGALDRAVMQVNSPQLLALHRAAGMHPTSFVG